MATAHEVVVVPKQASGGGMLVAVSDSAHLEFSTRSIDFGTVALTETEGTWVDVTNVSDRDVDVTVLIEPAELAESGELTVSPSSLQLASGEQERILVSFRPLSTQVYAIDLVFEVRHEGVREAHLETLSGAAVGSGAAVLAEGAFTFADGTAFSTKESNERFCVERRENFPNFLAAPPDRRNISSRFDTEVSRLTYFSEWGHIRHQHFWQSDFSASCDCDTECNLTATGSWTDDATPIEPWLPDRDLEFPHRAASAAMRDSGSVNSKGARRWAQGVMAVGAVECDRTLLGDIRCADTSLKISSGIKLGNDEIGGEVSLGADWTITPDRRSDIQELFVEVQCLPCVRAYNAAVKITGLAQGDVTPLKIKMTAIGPNVSSPIVEEVEITPQGEGNDDARAFETRVPNRSTVTLSTTDARCPNARASNVVADKDLELTFRCGGQTVDAKVNVQGDLGVGSAQVKLTTTQDTTRVQLMNIDKAGDFKFPSAIPKGSEWAIELSRQTCAQCTVSATPSLEGTDLDDDLQINLQCNEDLANNCGAEIASLVSHPDVASAEAVMTGTFADGTSLPPTTMQLSGSPQNWPNRLPTGTQFEIKVVSAESADPANPEVECTDFSKTVGSEPRIVAIIDCEVIGGDPNEEGEPEEGEEDIQDVGPMPVDCIWTPGPCGSGGHNCRLQREVVEVYDPQTNVLTITTTFYWECDGGNNSVFPWGGDPIFDSTGQLWTWAGPEVALGLPDGPLSGQVQIHGVVTSAHPIDRFAVRINGELHEAVAFDGTNFAVDLDTTQLDDGDHAIAVLAWNEAPMFTYPGFAFSVDNSPQMPGACTNDDDYPVLAFEPADGLQIAPGTVTISGTASDSSGLGFLAVWIDDVETAQFESSPFSVTTSMAVGTYAVTVVTEDVCGKLTQRTHTIEVTENPINCEPGVDSLVWTSPNGTTGPYAAGDTVTLAVSASDVDGIDRVEIWAGPTLVDTLTAAPYQTSWTATMGVEEVTAVAYDACDNTSTAVASVTVVDDACDGTITTTLLSPAHGAELGVGNNYHLSASASDAHGISRVRFYKTIGGNDFLIGEDTTADPPGSPFGPYWLTWTPDEGDLSVTAIKAIAWSSCGGGSSEFSSDSHPVSVFDPNACDGAIDWLNFVSPAQGAALEAGTPVSLTAQGGDAQGLSILRFYKVVGGSEVQIGEVSAALAPIQPVGITWTPGPADVGVSELRVRAYSVCGDGLTDSDFRSRWVSVSPSDTCDGVVDSVTLSSPVDQQQLFRGSLITLAAQASDTQGISTIQFWKTLNGNEQLIAERVGDDVTYNWIPEAADLGVTAISAKGFSACGDGATDSGTDSHTVTVIEGCDGVVDSLDFTSPVDGAQLTVGVTTTLQASASDGQGINNVRFYRLVGSSEYFIGLSTGDSANINWTPSASETDTTGILARAYSACGTGADDRRDVTHAVTVVNP